MEQDPAPGNRLESCARRQFMVVWNRVLVSKPPQEALCPQWRRRSASTLQSRDSCIMPPVAFTGSA